jgi:NodT family efflux transporter outer membrane factor (OMF) lipoprotein
MTRRTHLTHGLAAGRPGLAALALAALLAGCAGPVVRPGATPAPGVPDQLPLAAGTAAAVDERAPTDWRNLVRDPQLRALITQALANNRDLRVAVLNVQRAQAQFQATDANRSPTLGVGGGVTRAPNSVGKEANTFTAGVQLASWELDLFGRLQGLSDAARAQVLASEAGAQATALALVAQVVQGALALQADNELLQLAQRTLDSRESTLKLTALREQVGASSQLDLQAQRTLVAQARAALAQAQRAQQQDRNALALLVGAPVPDDALPRGPLAAEAVAEVPVGLSSQVLLRRPDVVQAEATLRGAQANIAAARAAYWPSITLTAQAGQASPTLAGLFNGGTFVYTAAANALFTVFDAGRRQANIDSAVAAQQVAVAQYERSVQSAFRDTADALAGITTWRAQLAAQNEQLAAVRETARLTELKASQGAANELERLDAQRSLLATEQATVALRLAELNNRVALFKAVGGPLAP